MQLPQPHRAPRWALYLLAVLVSAACLALRQAIAPDFGQRPLLILFMLPVVLSAFAGGLWPGLLATAVCGLGSNYLGIPPLDSLYIAETHDLVQWLVFLLSGALVSLLSERLLVARRLLSEAEERNAKLFRSMNEGLCVLEMLRGPGGEPVDYQLREVNPAYEAILGVRREQVLGRRVTEALGLKSAPDLERFAAMLERGAPIQFDSLVPELGRHFLVSAFPIEGDAFGVLFQDVTERKVNEAEVAASESRFRELFERLPLPLCFVDRQGRLASINQRFTELFGYALEQVPTLEEWWRLAYPDPRYRAQVLETWTSDLVQALKESRCLTPRTYHITCRDGRMLSCAISGMTVRGGFVASFVDLTDQLKAEMALRESELKFRTVADFTYDWEYWRGTDGRMLWVSPSCERVSGYTAQEFLADGDLAQRIVHPADLEQYTGHLDAPGGGQSPRSSFDMRILKRSGEVVWINHKCESIFRDDGEPLGRRVCNTDITVRKRMELDLKKAKEVAETSSQAKSAFLANMSHEIRTPLNGMLGMLQLLANDDDGPDRDQYVDLAMQAGTRLLSLLNDILDFSSMEAGRLELHAEPFHVGELLESVNNLFRLASAAKGLDLNLSLDESVPEQLLGDAARIRQILFNLVGNAIKFTARGSVAVEAWSEIVPARPGLVRLYLRVSDTGIGIPDEQVGYVFQRFTQSDASYSRRYEGAGLGLAIVKRLVELMGGSIAVDSELGRGTSIYLHLSLSLPQAAGHAPQEAAARSAPLRVPPMRILLAEDEAVSRLATGAMLRRMGHTVTTVDNGLDAVRQCVENSFDCVLMDIQMPGLDGVQAALRIRAERDARGLPRLPVVALTAYAMAGDRDRLLAAGMDAYLGKPVQEGDLASAVAQFAPAAAAAPLPPEGVSG